MFKIIKIEYYDQFKCWNAACPDNCCYENWNINIDEETYEKYVQCGIEQLDSKITKEVPHRIIPQDGKCPFITSEGLCSIHGTHGENLLSNTCKSYPRFVSEYEDLYIEALGLSCPAVVSLLLELEQKCFLREEIYYESEEEKGQAFPQRENEKVMKQIISLFYQWDSIEKSLEEAYAFLEIEKKVSLDKDSLTEKVNREINSKYPFFLANVCISYLFEHIMLESKKDIPQYVKVLDKCLFLLENFEKQLSDCFEENHVLSDDDIITTLYKIMRKQDHAS
jgi:hypothetical protein